ncbi:hypothetical protein SPI_02742 [Niveomyces insectorum RCEF 264]|uniref:Uncharacterized protein n=1 Tax=Niveomyces insectorum RCEF 264 TaxID=1081102 RepID=A0A167Y7Z6_9HYPO|nr:hypothetical protein SPI_02742 [Niveomyces insectorum RCEF 264]
MEALLGAADSDGPQCRSVDDLKAKIAQLFVGKVSETRAEHVSASFDIPGVVALNLGAATGHNGREAVVLGSAEGNTGDPASGGGGGGNHLNPLIRNVVNVRDVVMNQPEEKPIMQRAVAGFLIMSVRQADGSMWDMQSTTRAAQGWTITYVCQNSLGCWLKAHKHRHVVGQSIHEDMSDTISLSRPAFDCRGMVSITFSRFSRSIVVKYEHTNFHRTVAEMAKFFPPPRPPSPLPILAGAAPGSTSKRQRAAGDEQGNGTPKAKKAKRASAAGTNGGPDGEEGAPKRKRTTKNALAATATAATQALAALGVEGGATVDGGSAGLATGDETAEQTTTGANGNTPKKPRKPQDPTKKKRNQKSDAAGGAAGDANGGVANTSTATANLMMDLGIDVTAGSDMNDSAVAEALLRHLNEFPEDNTESASAILDAVLEHTRTTEVGPQAMHESPAGAAATSDARGSSNSASGATGQQPASSTGEFSQAQDAASATAQEATTASATTMTTDARVPAYELVTEAEVSSLRKQTAIRLLSERNVDPATLNREQFCTFANQAPSLQKESLELFAQYGAERLAIVPAGNQSNAGNQGSTSSSAQASHTRAPATQATPAPPPAPTAVPATQPMTAQPDTPANNTKKATRRPRKSKQSQDDAAAAAAAAGSIASPATYTAPPGHQSKEGEPHGSWANMLSTTTSAPQPQQLSTAAIDTTPATASGRKKQAAPGSRRKSASNTVQQSPSQVGAVDEGWGHTQTSASDKPAKAPRKPRQRKKGPAAAEPAESNPSPALTAQPDCNNNNNAGPQTQQATEMSPQFHGTYPTVNAQLQQQQQQLQQVANAASAGMRASPTASNTAGAQQRPQQSQRASSILSPPVMNTAQPSPVLSGYHTSTQQNAAAAGHPLSYTQNAGLARGATAAAANEASVTTTGTNAGAGSGAVAGGDGAGYGQYSYARTSTDSSASQTNQANPRLAFDNYAYDYSRRPDAPTYTNDFSDYGRHSGDASSSASGTTRTAASLTTATTADYPNALPQTYSGNGNTNNNNNSNINNNSGNNNNQWPTTDAGGNATNHNAYGSTTQRAASTETTVSAASYDLPRPSEWSGMSSVQTNVMMANVGRKSPSNLEYAQLLQERQRKQAQQQQQQQQKQAYAQQQQHRQQRSHPQEQHQQHPQKQVNVQQPSAQSSQQLENWRNYATTQAASSQPQAYASSGGGGNGGHDGRGVGNSNQNNNNNGNGNNGANGNNHGYTPTMSPQMHLPSTAAGATRHHLANNGAYLHQNQHSQQTQTQQHQQQHQYQYRQQSHRPQAQLPQQNRTAMGLDGGGRAYNHDSNDIYEMPRRSQGT